jgi:hypothetical protein
MSMELQARAAVARLTLDMLAFNPRQLRGPDGRWIKSGAGASPPAAAPAPPRVARKPAGRTGANSWLDAIRRGESTDDAKRQIGEMFEYTDPQTGYRSEVTQVNANGSAERPSYFAIISIKDPTGLEVGRATRSVWPIKTDPSKSGVQHGSFLLSRRVQGGGFSKRWLAQMEDRYREAGIDRITLFTDDVGGYAWAKAGFDFENRDGAKHVASLLGRKLRSKEGKRDLPQRVITDGEELIRRAQSTDPEERPTPMEFAMLGWTPGAQTWVGKESMLGSGWGGVKRL